MSNFLKSVVFVGQIVIPGKSTILIYVSVMLTVIAGPWQSPGQTQNVEGIVAVINEEVISRYDLNARTNMIIRSSNLKDSRQLRKRLARQVLRALIDEKLKLQEAKRLKITVDDKDLKSAKRRIEKQNKLAPGGLESHLKREGIELSTLVDQIRATLSWARVLKRRVAGSVDVSDNDIATELARINANLDKPSYEVSTILLIVDQPRNAARAKRDADRLVDEIRRGASFADLALQFSHDASARQSGRLGWIQLGQLEKIVDDILVRMRPGDISHPIRTSAGYRIIALRNHRANSRSNADQAKVALRQILVPIPPNTAANDVAALEARMQTVAGTITGCNDMARAAKELGQEALSGLVTVKVRELPRALRGIVAGLAIGRASQPVQTKEGLRILMVCERKTPAIRLPTRKDVRLKLLNQKVELFSRRHLRELRQTAFVEIRL